MRKVFYFAFFIITITGINIFGQQPQRGGTIKGKVVDAATSVPLSRANVSIITLPDSSVATGAVADASGKFEINNVRLGTYIVRINYVGYETFNSEPIAITREIRTVDINTVELVQSAARTNAVEVTAERQMVEYSQGKRIFNVDKNIAATGGTALDIIKNIPSVSVDIDGNVSLRGSSNFRLQINGKPTSINPTIFFEQTPASSIESIEIITNPSARYDAEGMTGIINVILNQKRDDGLNGLFSVNLGTRDKYSFSVNSTYQYGDWNFFLNYDYGSRRMQGNGNSYRITRLIDTTELLQDFKNRRSFLNQGIRTGFEYNITKFDQLSMSASYRASEGTRKRNIEYENYLNFATNPNSLYNRFSKEEDDNPYWDYSLNYKHNFGERGHDLTFDVYFSEFDRNNDGNYTEIWQTPIGTVLEEASKSDDINRNINIQSDYSYPFGNFKLETGAKVSFQKLDNDYKFFEYSALDTNKSNHFIYNERISAAYAIISGKFDDFSVQFGLRAEHSTIDTELKTTGEKNNQDYANLFPSANFSYKLSKTDEFQINYSRRINRPRSQFLNPFVDYSDPYNLRSGNPNLKPEFINAYELAYVKNFKIMSITPTLFYRQTDDKISFVADVVSDGKIKTTFENVAKGTNYGLELNVTFDYFKFMRLSSDFSYYRSEIKGKDKSLEMDNNDYSWSIRSTASVFLSPELSMQLMGFYTGPTVTPQGQRYSFSSLDFGARYEMFDRKLALTFRISDILNEMKFGGYAQNSSFYSRYTMKRESRVAYLGFQYKINEGPKQRERRRQTENTGGGMDFDEF
ncbi:MAG TPA: TonB-dependent receptor [Candidatus Kapabacteria bacterium]|nr:TonB-dependent receptor [Candidatus Kapabacteria bacterium]